MDLLHGPGQRRVTELPTCDTDVPIWGLSGQGQALSLSSGFRTQHGAEGFTLDGRENVSDAWTRAVDTKVDEGLSW